MRLSSLGEYVNFTGRPKTEPRKSSAALGSTVEVVQFYDINGPIRKDTGEETDCGGATGYQQSWITDYASDSLGYYIINWIN